MNSLKPFQLECRALLTVRLFASRSPYRVDDADKSPHQLAEEGKKTPVIHGQEYPNWRRPWGERKGEHFSLLKPFISERNPRPDILYAMSMIPEMNMTKVMAWWNKMKDYNEIENQKFISERVEILGSNLAAAHYFLYRKATIRFRGSKNWLKGYVTDPKSDLKLPLKYEEGYFVEAIDASTFHKNGIRYEGLENLTELNFLKWLSLRNNKLVDEWCLDRVAGCVGDTLEYLDLTGCQLNCGGVIALSRMRALKMLIITDPEENKELEAALSELEQLNTQLLIKYDSPNQLTSGA